jgi:hypothetical protein
MDWRAGVVVLAVAEQGPPQLERDNKKGATKMGSPGQRGCHKSYFGLSIFVPDPTAGIRLEANGSGGWL